MPLRFWVAVLALCVIPASVLAGQSASDSAAVIAASKDYIDGYWERDSTRLRRALHPELVKRQVVSSRTGTDRISALTTDGMVSAAGRFAGRPVDQNRQSDVKILHMFGNMATVVIDAGQWIDYLHLARWNGEYRIFNIMYDFRRPPRAPSP